MLQSVPDPFDSYGPPQAEDQIFTILPPLAVIANAPSPSPSPLANTPPSSCSPPDVINNHSWAPTSNFFSNSSSEWSDVSSTSSTPPRSTSPSATIKRRQSHPPSASHHSRKSDSKLRSVLTVIDESHVVHTIEGPPLGRSEPRPASPSDVNGGAPEPEEWGVFGYGEIPTTDSIRGDETPRHPAATLHTPSYDHDQTMEPGLAADTRSDRTIHLDAGRHDSA
jgi:hypothetical protein